MDIERTYFLSSALKVLPQVYVLVDFDIASKEEDGASGAAPSWGTLVSTLERMLEASHHFCAVSFDESSSVESCAVTLHDAVQHSLSLREAGSVASEAGSVPPVVLAARLPSSSGVSGAFLNAFRQHLAPACTVQFLFAIPFANDHHGLPQRDEVLEALGRAYERVEASSSLPVHTYYSPEDTAQPATAAGYFIYCANAPTEDHQVFNNEAVLLVRDYIVRGNPYGYLHPCAVVVPKPQQAGDAAPGLLVSPTSEEAIRNLWITCSSEAVAAGTSPSAVPALDSLVVSRSLFSFTLEPVKGGGDAPSTASVVAYVASASLIAAVLEPPEEYFTEGDHWWVVVLGQKGGSSDMAAQNLMVRLFGGRRGRHPGAVFFSGNSPRYAAGHVRLSAVKVDQVFVYPVRLPIEVSASERHLAPASLRLDHLHPLRAPLNGIGHFHYWHSHVMNHTLMELASGVVNGDVRSLELDLYVRGSDNLLNRSPFDEAISPTNIDSSYVDGFVPSWSPEVDALVGLTDVRHPDIFYTLQCKEIPTDSQISLAAAIALLTPPTILKPTALDEESASADAQNVVSPQAIDAQLAFRAVFVILDVKHRGVLRLARALAERIGPHRVMLHAFGINFDASHELYVQLKHSKLSDRAAELVGRGPTEDELRNFKANYGHMLDFEAVDPMEVVKASLFPHLGQRCAVNITCRHLTVAHMRDATTKTSVVNHVASVCASARELGGAIDVVGLWLEPSGEAPPPDVIDRLLKLGILTSHNTDPAHASPDVPAIDFNTAHVGMTDDMSRASLIEGVFC